MPAIGETHELLRGVDQSVELLAERNRDDAVALTVQDKHRRRYLANAQIGTERILEARPPKALSCATDQSFEPSTEARDVVL